MKPLYLFIAISSCVLWSCSKKTSAATDDEALLGRWKLTDQYTGNGAGGETHETFVDVFYMYTVTDSLYIRYPGVTFGYILVSITDSSYVYTHADNPNVFRYDITGNKMEIRTPCANGCRLLLTKIDD